MMKRLSRWYKNTLKIILLLIFLSVYAYAGDPKTSAEAAAKAVTNKYGTSEGIKQNVSLPLTSSSAPIKTIDNNQSYNLQITNPSTSSFLNIDIAGSATGDLTKLKIDQDLNFDGKFDYSYKVPFIVSGICSNGIINCDAGTWDNCKFYKWLTDDRAKVRLEQTAITDLAGCFCINQSCEANNYNMVLNTLGGGIVGIIQNKKEYLITDVKRGDNFISYYGQDTSNSVSFNENEIFKNSYQNPNTLKQDAINETLIQSNDSNSLYSNISKAVENRGDNADYKKCSIRRNVLINKLTLEDIISPVRGTGKVVKCGDNCIDIILGKIGDDYWRGSCKIFETDYTVFVKKPNLISDAVLIYAKWDDYIQIWIGENKVYNGPNSNFPPETPGACELSTSWSVYLNKNVTEYFKKYGEVDTKVRVSVTGGGEGYAYIRVKVNTLTEIVDDIYNGCKVYESSDCILSDETIDGVLTYSNFNPTGEIHLPITKNINYKPITRDWWKKERKYLCKDNSKFDLSKSVDKADRVVSTTNQNDYIQSEFSYTDLNNSKQSLRLPNINQKYDDLVCKTIKTQTDDRVGVSGLTANSNKNEVYYHKCIDGKCPAKDNETIIKDCQDINEFNEAAAVMSALKEASKDIDCESGYDSSGACIEGKFKIFSGIARECLDAGVKTSFFDCCNDNIGSWLIFKERCNADSIAVTQALQANRAHQVGDYYCVKEVLGVCVQKAKKYCLFNSALARIVHEQGRAQLNRFKNGWGTAQSPFCDGLTPEEFSTIDFSKINFFEIFQNINPQSYKATDAAEKGIGDFYENIRIK